MFNNHFLMVFVFTNAVHVNQGIDVNIHVSGLGLKVVSAMSGDVSSVGV